MRRAFAFNRRLLTRRVKGGIRKFVRHAPDNAVILAKYIPANCVYRLMCWSKAGGSMALSQTSSRQGQSEIYAAADSDLRIVRRHERGRRRNNRAENLHQPTRRRECKMSGFKCLESAQRFLSIHTASYNHLQRQTSSTGRFSDSDGSFAPHARHTGLKQRKMQWRSPAAIRLTLGRPADRLARVQGERQRSLPTLRQLPWPCDPGAMNGSLLYPVALVFPTRQQADLAALDKLIPAFCQNLADILPIAS